MKAHRHICGKTYTAVADSVAIRTQWLDKIYGIEAHSDKIYAQMQIYIN